MPSDPQDCNVHHSGNTFKAVGARWWSIDNTTISEQVNVSTVCLAATPSDVNEITQWETLVFGGPKSGWGVRTGSAEAARVSHDATVAFLRRREDQHPGRLEATAMTKMVVLVKHVADGTGVPKGHKYTYSYLSQARHVAEHKATKALLRDHPKENRDSWQLEPEA